MKNWRKVTAVAVLAMAVTATAFAGSISDVPSNHWAYQSVQKLTKAGLIDGYGDGTFRGDKAISRYEFAIIVDKAMDKYDSADAANRKLIDDLSLEFGKELKSIGVRMSKLEKRVGITVSGDTKITYLWNKPTYKPGTLAVASSNQWETLQRITFKEQINEQLTGFVRLKIGTSKLGADTSTSPIGADARVDQMYFTFKNTLGFDNIRLGRFGFDSIGVGLMAKPGIDGALFEKKIGVVNVKAWTGPVKSADSPANVNSQVTTGQLEYKPSKDLKVRLGYYNADVSGNGLIAGKANSNTHNSADGSTFDASKGWSYSFDLNMGKGSLIGEYISTTLQNAKGFASSNPKGWAVQYSTRAWVPLFYPIMPIVNPTLPVGTDNWIIGYRSVDAGTTPQNIGGFDTTVADGGGPGVGLNPLATDNVNGVTIAYGKVLMKNVLLTLETQRLKVKDKAHSPWAAASSSNIDNVYRVYLAFFW